MERKPGLAIVELGANGLLHGVDLARTDANLDEILAMLTSCGIAILQTDFEVPPFLRAHAPAYDSMCANPAARHAAAHGQFFPLAVMRHTRLTPADGHRSIAVHRPGQFLSGRPFIADTSSIDSASSLFSRSRSS